MLYALRNYDLSNAQKRRIQLKGYLIFNKYQLMNSLVIAVLLDFLALSFWGKKKEKKNPHAK